MTTAQAEEVRLRVASGAVAAQPSGQAEVLGLANRSAQFPGRDGPAKVRECAWHSRDSDAVLEGRGLVLQ